MTSCSQVHGGWRVAGNDLPFPEAIPLDQAPRHSHPAGSRFKASSRPLYGNIYVGGFMGSAVAGIDPETDERWDFPRRRQRDPPDREHGRVQPERIYLGTYSWADIISWDVISRDAASSYEHVVRLSNPYLQSRPFGLANEFDKSLRRHRPGLRTLGRRARQDRHRDEYAGVGAGWCRSGIDPRTTRSIGLVADDEYVYGTTSVREWQWDPRHRWTRPPLHVRHRYTREGLGDPTSSRAPASTRLSSSRAGSSSRTWRGSTSSIPETEGSRLGTVSWTRCELLAPPRLGVSGDRDDR